MIFSDLSDFCPLALGLDFVTGADKCAMRARQSQCPRLMREDGHPRGQETDAQGRRSRRPVEVPHG
eukprot:9476407-Pyramimonas_sp.AAC.2